jgi:three-Cys-motif partner protein
MSSTHGGPEREYNHHGRRQTEIGDTQHAHRLMAMAVPRTVLWKRDPHTAAKHDMLRRYLEAWFPILLQSQYFKAVTYLDGFAGPGEYTNAPQAGSPLIALGQVLDRPEIEHLGKPANFVFIEDDARRLKHLQQLVAQRWPSPPAHVAIAYYGGKCQDTALDALTAVGAWGQPIFANLDPFGVDVPAELVRRLAQNPSTEVLVTLMSDWFTRFATVTENSKGDDQFGSTSWRQVANKPTDQKERFLVEQYRQTLIRCGLKFTLAFQLVDEGGHALFLVFGTGNEKGLEKMKDAMWKIDAVEGLRFRDPRDPNQAMLDFGPAAANTGPLIPRLQNLLRQKGPLNLDVVRTEVLLKTVYRKPHATQAVRDMIKLELLERPAGRLSGRTIVSLKG